jgi:sugar/nucleoside kinase (ribokinase family)
MVKQRTMKSKYQSFDIVVAGELNADLILTGDITPTFNQVERLVNDANLTLGSSSAIFACGAARLGLRVAFLGKVGNDVYGNFVINELIKRNVATEGIISSNNEKTGLTVILNRGNDRAILTYPGTIATTQLGDLNTTLLENAHHLHLGGYYLLSRLKRNVPNLFKLAHRLGLTVSLDTNYDPTGQWDGGISNCLKHVDVFLPNERELLSVTRTKRIREAVSSLSQIVPILAVKMGKKGAMVFTTDGQYKGLPIKTDVVDSVGAGDSFDAGFIYGYLHHWEMQRIVNLACVCGSLSTLSVGGIEGQPTINQASRFL